MRLERAGRTSPRTCRDSSARLALENLALRQQLAVHQRSVERPKLKDGDRMFWSMACEFPESWKEHLVIVKADTVIRWHRQGYRH